ncbi:alternative oxidase-domain-containing protein [Pyronema domesticum]|uniref:Alternative oxidase n=1 Tax=Pyronema omphalodes (strain CBS 100304) TaxID=1076935 RepID=U4LRA1_PYROM|nr:alternative oxidase-domain-containing protein [Pyronema domesticum]CCX34485.1 Similar to Alternative oxidase, mitochondrial; acc. no. Q9P959 [Pyronema omphalodes CBS 100304]
MLTTKHTCVKALPRLSAQLLPVISQLSRHKPASVILLQHARSISSSPAAQDPRLQHLKINPEYVASWSHPIYTESQMKSIEIAHRNAETWSDYVALTAVRIFRSCFDFATGYRHEPHAPQSITMDPKSPAANSMVSSSQTFTSDQWLTRIIFLESIAGVPGMVAGMVRHLQSLRLLRLDNGWISTLLEESQNERMHLMTFLHFRQPGWFMRAMLLAGQGVFFNAFFMAYLVSPRTCHRFVGYLEEEAVLTYSRVIEEMEKGNIAEWEKLEVPEIAVGYFGLLKSQDSPKGGMLELLKVIRADEAKHREVNHTFANLRGGDVNPYAVEWASGPTKGLERVRQTGWEKEELARVAEAEGKFVEK